AEWLVGEANFVVPSLDDEAPLPTVEFLPRHRVLGWFDRRRADVVERSSLRKGVLGDVSGDEDRAVRPLDREQPRDEPFHWRPPRKRPRPTRRGPGTLSLRGERTAISSGRRARRRSHPGHRRHRGRRSGAVPRAAWLR